MAPPAPDAKPAKPRKRRYAAGSGDGTERAESSAPVKKLRPAHAPALPRTLPLQAGGGARAGASTTFSAERFDELPLDPYLARQLADRLRLSAMTPVQQRTIPALLGGADALVRSPTGSGKTLAYAVPAVQQLVALGSGVVTRGAGTFCLVLVPTRELAVQSHEAIESLARPFPWLVTTTLMGGERKKASPTTTTLT